MPIASCETRLEILSDWTGQNGHMNVASRRGWDARLGSAPASDPIGSKIRLEADLSALDKNNVGVPMTKRNGPRAGKLSAGVLVYRFTSGVLEVFLVHPGGPFWARRDAGAWSIPKGEANEGEDLLRLAKREFHEETGSPIDGEFIELTPLRQPGGKLVHAWAINGQIDASSVRSNTFSMEWPPRSGTQRQFPEIDRADWFTLAEAADKLLPGQRGFLQQLTQKVGVAAPDLLAPRR